MAKRLKAESDPEAAQAAAELNDHITTIMNAGEGVITSRLSAKFQEAAKFCFRDALWQVLIGLSQGFQSVFIEDGGYIELTPRGDDYAVSYVAGQARQTSPDSLKQMAHSKVKDVLCGMMRELEETPRKKLTTEVRVLADLCAKTEIAQMLTPLSSSFADAVVKSVRHDGYVLPGFETAKQQDNGTYIVKMPPWPKLDGMF